VLPKAPCVCIVHCPHQGVPPQHLLGVNKLESTPTESHFTMLVRICFMACHPGMPAKAPAMVPWSLVNLDFRFHVATGAECSTVCHGAASRPLASHAMGNWSP